jgi:hypothetical protein
MAYHPDADPILRAAYKAGHEFGRDFEGDPGSNAGSDWIFVKAQEYATGRLFSELADGPSEDDREICVEWQSGFWAGWEGR